jgi:hypothetical protein
MSVQGATRGAAATGRLTKIAGSLMKRFRVRSLKNDSDPASLLDPAVRSALVAESTQAWDHYRHVENQRNSYIGFFLTANLGFTALVGTVSAIVKARFLGWPTVALGFAFLFFECLSIGIFLAIRRFDSVLNLYAQIIVDARTMIFSDAPDEIRTALHQFSIYGRMPKHPYDEQMIVEASFAALAGVYTICATALPIFSFVVSGFTTTQRVVSITVALTALVIYGLFLTLLGKIRRVPTPNLQSSGLSATP